MKYNSINVMEGIQVGTMTGDVLKQNTLKANTNNNLNITTDQHSNYSSNERKYSSLKTMKSEHQGSRVWQSSMPVPMKHLAVRQHPKSAIKRIGGHNQSKNIRNFRDLRSETEASKLALEVPGHKIEMTNQHKKRGNKSSMMAQN